MLSIKTTRDSQLLIIICSVRQGRVVANFYSKNLIPVWPGDTKLSVRSCIFFCYFRNNASDSTVTSTIWICIIIIITSVRRIKTLFKQYFLCFLTFDLWPCFSTPLHNYISYSKIIWSESIKLTHLMILISILLNIKLQTHFL